MGDTDTGIIVSPSGDVTLGGGSGIFFSSDTPVTVQTVPSSQSDFNVAGPIANPTAVLSGIASSISSVAAAVGNVQQAGASASFNRAVAAQNQALGLQQLQTQGKISTLQTQTALVQAQAAYNKAAGVLTNQSGTTLIIVLTVTGVVLMAMSLRKKK